MQQSVGWGAPALPFLAVGRVQDGVILAYYCVNDNTDEQRELNKDVFRKLLAAAQSKLAPSQRTRLQWNEGSVCCLMDPKGALLYCAVTTLLTYPERLAYQLLYDLVVAVQQLGESRMEQAPEQSLNEVLGQKMRELVQQYEDPANFPQLQVAMDRLNQPASFEANSRAAFSTEQGGGMQAVRDQRKSRMIKILAGVVACLFVFIMAMVFQGRSKEEVTTTTKPTQNAALPAPEGVSEDTSIVLHT